MVRVIDTVPRTSSSRLYNPQFARRCHPYMQEHPPHKLVPSKDAAHPFHATHLTPHVSLRAWCKQCLPGRRKKTTRSVPALQGGARVYLWSCLWSYVRLRPCMTTRFPPPKPPQREWPEEVRLKSPPEATQREGVAFARQDGYHATAVDLEDAVRGRREKEKRLSRVAYIACVEV